MPKISSYPIISVPGLEDLLIGTDINNLEETKNFRLSDISVLLGSGYVPYTGATGNINLGAFGITANSFIKAGGTSLQFLKADGSSDSTQYTPQSRTITINGISYDLSANRSWNFGGVDVLTTSGSSGPATYVEGFLNIPQYQPAGNYITSLSGEATGSGPGAAAVTLSNSAVIGKLLTGFNVVAGSIISSDSILQAFGKAQSQINALASGVSFRGTWNASTNTPALASGVGTGGHYYVVSVAGSTSLNGVSTWAVGDWVIFNGVSSVWQRIPNTQLVSSVNGFTGAVSLTSSDVGAAPTSRTLTINGTAFDLSANRSWTVGDIRSDQSYGNPSWITSLDWAKVSSRPSTIAGYGITNAALSTTTITINGIGYDLSANRVWSVGTVTSVSVTGPLTGGAITGSGTIGITQAGPTSSGFLSSADWNMFNSKVSSISATLPLSFISGTISISQAGTSSDGYLSQSDWNSFNQKQDAIVNPITGIGSSGFLPMFTGPGDLSDSPISYSSNSLLVNYSSTIGNSFVLENTGIGSYSYSILMNNFAINKSTTHFYSEGLIVDVIGENQVRRVFPNGNTVFGVSTVDNGNKLSVYGTIFSSNIPNAAINTDRFLVSDSGVVKYRTASELFSDIGSSRSITINGVTQNLSSDRSWSVGTVTSVSVSAPVGFTVAGSPITGSGTIAIAFASGYSLPTNGAQASWDIAYNNMIVSAAVTGTTTKTLTLNQQDGGTVTASWVESGGGGTPGGSNTQVQFNNSGSFGGSSDFTWNGSALNVFGVNISKGANNVSGNILYGTGLSNPSMFGSGNTSIGLNNFAGLWVGTDNLAVGQNIANSGGFHYRSTYVGSGAGADAMGNTNVVAVGFSAGTNNGNGNNFQNCTFVGAYTSTPGNFGSLSNSTAIGYGALINQSNQIVLGNSSVTSLLTSATITASGFVRSGGAASQFLKADGSIDSSVYLTANQTITLSGDVTGSGATSISTTIANNAVSLAKMAQISTDRILGRVTAATGNVESLTGTQVTTLLDTFTSTLKGLVPSPGSVGSTRFLREDGTWVVPSGGGGGTPAGSNRQIQYNNSGVFGADANFSWSTGNRLLVGTATDNGVDILQVSGIAIVTRLKINTSGSTIQIHNFYPSGGSTTNLWIGTSASSFTSVLGGNTAVGVQSLNFVTTGYQNTSLGTNSLFKTTSGILNTSIGAFSMNENLTGGQNVAIGAYALEKSTSGSLNTAIGKDAMKDGLSPASSVAVGVSSLLNNIGTGNVAVGNNSMNDNTTGNNNVALGPTALRNNLTGSNNISIGDTAGSFDSLSAALTISNNSIFIGASTRALGNNETNQIVIGHNAIGQGSNSVTLGNSSITQTLLRGTVTAGSYVKSGATSSDVLYGDGSTKKITSGTAAPSGGSDGDIYLQYV